MARDATITLDDVAAAAEAITAEGARPTLRGVRDRLGRGSLGTVQKLLAQWHAQRHRAAEASAINLPTSVQNAIMAFVGEQVAAGKADLETQLAEAQQAAADLAAEVERQASAIEELEQALDAERQAKAQYVGQVEQLKADLDDVRAELARERQATEESRLELAKASLRLEAIPRLEAELERLREALDIERQARHEAEIKLARLEGGR